MFCPGWIRLCISILEVWTGHRHVTEKWEGAMRSLGLGGSLPDYLSHSPAVWSPAGEDMKLWCRGGAGAGGGGSQSRGQRRLLGAAELAVSHQPSLFQLDQVDAKDVKKTLKQMVKSNCTYQRIRRSHKTQSSKSVFFGQKLLDCKLFKTGSSFDSGGKRSIVFCFPCLVFSEAPSLLQMSLRERD